MDFPDSIAGAAKLPKPGAPPIAGVAFWTVGGFAGGRASRAEPKHSASGHVVGVCAQCARQLSNIEEYIRATAKPFVRPRQIVDSAMLLHRSSTFPFGHRSSPSGMPTPCC